MAFDKQRAERKLGDILQRIGRVTASMQEDIVKYRGKDTLQDEDDEYKTMRDIRFYLLKNYREVDGILTQLDFYK
jgi:hypothetical protein